MKVWRISKKVQGIIISSDKEFSTRSLKPFPFLPQYFATLAIAGTWLTMCTSTLRANTYCFNDCWDKRKLCYGSKHLSFVDEFNFSKCSYRSNIVFSKLEVKEAVYLSRQQLGIIAFRNVIMKFPLLYQKRKLANASEVTQKHIMCKSDSSASS